MSESNINPQEDSNATRESLPLDVAIGASDVVLPTAKDDLPTVHDVDKAALSVCSEADNLSDFDPMCGGRDFTERTAYLTPPQMRTALGKLHHSLRNLFQFRRVSLVGNEARYDDGRMKTEESTDVSELKVVHTAQLPWHYQNELHRQVNTEAEMEPVIGHQEFNAVNKQRDKYNQILDQIGDELRLDSQSMWCMMKILTPANWQNTNQVHPLLSLVAVLPTPSITQLAKERTTHKSTNAPKVHVRIWNFYQDSNPRNVFEGQEGFSTHRSPTKNKTKGKARLESLARSNRAEKLQRRPLEEKPARQMENLQQ